jgi:phosphohistidine swiveling domain-containing protein
MKNQPADDSQRSAELYKKQISLTEWFANISYADTEKIRAEDNEKRETLRELNQIIGLPYDAPMAQFASAAELADKNPQFAKFLREHGDDHCALRLIPLNPQLPKLRMRGRTVRSAMDWFDEQKINPDDYRADFMRHAGHAKWSAIFVANQHGVFGEVISGSHDQLTQGFYHDGALPHQFGFNFHEWTMAPADPDAPAHAQKIVNFIKVDDAKKRAKLRDKFGAKFAHNYLLGYFETIQNVGCDVEFCDFSRSLGDIYRDFCLDLSDETAKEILHGRGAAAGVARGKVHLVQNADDDFADGEVLVAPMTTPDLVGLMQKSAASITDQGGILSHAAIIARELQKPCVVGTLNATETLRDGQLVEVDGARGTVKLV